MSLPIGVVLVAYHGDRWVPSCVASLRKSFSGSLALILVDNAGNSCIKTLDLTAFDVTLLRCERPLGFAEANNLALTAAALDCDAVCFLNQDTVSEPGWLDACIDCLLRHPQLGVVTPLIMTYDGQEWDQAFLDCARRSEEFRREFGEWPPRSGEPLSGGCSERIYDVPVVTGAAMVVKTEALLKAGPFDPIYGSYYEDYDLCRRIAAVGYRVGICTRGRIRHFGGSVTTDRQAHRRRARWIARNRVLYAARWQWKNRLLGLARYLFTQLPRNLARATLGRSQTPLRSMLLAQVDLMRIAPRLVSAAWDRRCWNKYLRSIRWPIADSRGVGQSWQAARESG